MSRVLLVATMVFSLFSSSLSWSNDEGARESIIGVVDAFRSEIVQDKEVLASSPDLLRERIDKILTPIIDFDNFSKKVMGKYYRRASKDQHSRFAEVTKDTLLKTYGASLLDLDADKIKVLPLGPQGNGKDVKVDVDFEMESGGLLNIAFLMQEVKEGDWKLSNIIINNINFGLTFRKQFAVMMQQNKNNIDLAIEAWRESLAKKN